MKNYIIPSLRITIILMLLLSGMFPFLVSVIGKIAPGKGNGVSIEQNGKIIGYQNLGQSFHSNGYFHGRPSAVNYNAAGSGGSNKGPSNPDYLLTVQSRIDTFLVHNPGVSKSEIPVDLVTASGSGLDPNISVHAAQIQIKRIAKHRNMDETVLQQLVANETEKPLWGLFGPTKVNVLKLNLELNKLSIIQSNEK